MPQSRGITDSVVKPAWKEDDYKIVSGRELYEEHSLTAINRSVINSLTAFITGESSMEPIGSTEWPEVPADAMTEYFLVDGSWALRLISEQEMAKNEKLDHSYEFLKDLIEVHKRLVLQGTRDKETGELTDVTRVWQQRANDWIVRDVKNYGQTNEQVISTIEKYPLDAFVPHPSGKGLLYWNQFTYRRIEEIEQGIRQQTGKAALSLILSGYMGDVNQAREALAKGGEVIHVPGNPQITRWASSSTTDQLMKNGEQFLRLFLKNTMQIEISETAAVSGVSRRLAMTPMLHYVRQQQAKIKAVYETIGYELSLKGMNIMTPEERSAELDFLKRGRDEQIITPEQYMQSAQALYN